MSVIWDIVLAVVWIAIAFWPARVAGRKGHSFIGYFIFSLFFFPAASSSLTSCRIGSKSSRCMAAVSRYRVLGAGATCPACRGVNRRPAAAARERWRTAWRPLKRFPVAQGKPPKGSSARRCAFLATCQRCPRRRRPPVLDAIRHPDDLADQARKLQKAAPMLRQAVTPLLTGQVDWQAEYAYSPGVQAFIYGFPYIYNAKIRHKWVTQPRDPAVIPYAA